MKRNLLFIGGSSRGGRFCCTLCEGLCFSCAVLHLSYFISMALHPCLSHHIPHFCSSSDNGCSCYPLQTSLCRIVFPACYTKTCLPCSPREGQGRMALELLSPRSTMKQDHRALVMWESPGAAGTGTDGSSAKPD